MNTPKLDSQAIVLAVVEKSMVSIVICITTIAGASALVLSFFVLKLLWVIIWGIHSSFGVS